MTQVKERRLRARTRDRGAIQIVLRLRADRNYGRAICRSELVSGKVEAMRNLVFAAPFLLIAGGACAEDARVDRIDVVDKGLYAVATGQDTPDPNTPTGWITAVESVANIEATAEVPARVGVEFGFRYTVVGEPSGAEVTLDMVNTYPAPGLRDPNGKRPVLESRYQRTKRVGETQYLGYGFENAWEAVPGVWTFQIWYDGRKLAEESFTVTQ